MGKTIYILEKILFLTVSFIAIIGILSYFKIWSVEQNKYFLFIGDWESLIVIFVIVTGTTFIMEKLWKWEVRQVFHKKRRR